MPEQSDDVTWPDFAIGLYDRLTGRDAEIVYSFEDFSIKVPDKVGSDANHANWNIDGELRIYTEES